MPKFCPKCGKKLKPGIKFCSSCGKTLKANPSKASHKRSNAKKAAGSPSAGPKSAKTTTARPVSPVRPATPSSPAHPVRPVPPAHPVYQTAPPPRKKGGMGCGMGCGIGCLVIAIVAFLIIAALIGVGYYFLFMRESEAGEYFDIEDASKSQKKVKCDDSVACLDENLKKCARAEGETEIGEFAEVDLEILGKSDGSCVVYAEVTKMKDIPSQLDVIPSFMLDKILESFSMECLIPKRIYTLGEEDTREYIADNMFDACRGKTIDLLKSLGVEEFEYE